MNSDGSAFIMILFVIAALTGATSYYFYRAKDESLRSSRQQINSDMDKIMSLIGGIAFTPANCNATFYLVANRSTPGNLTAIKTCPAGVNCRTTGAGTGTTVITKYPSGAGASWSTGSDYSNTLTYSNGISSKIRIVGLDYFIAPADVQTATAPAYLTLAVKFEVKLSPDMPAKIFAVRNLRFPILTAANAVATTITGCPRSTQALTAY